MNSIYAWGFYTSLMVIVVLVVTMATTEPLVIKECNIVTEASMQAKSLPEPKTLGELKYLINEGEYNGTQIY